MSETRTLTVPDGYRPTASTAVVHDQVIACLSDVVIEAAEQAASFIRLVRLYDRDAATAVRYGHVVDASECLEIALTHLDQLKATLNYRLCVEDARHAGEPAF